MSDSKPTTKRRPSLKIHHPHLRPAPLEACEACGVLFRFCEGCYAWGCKCGDPVSVCQSCHQATCGNCGTPYGFVTADDPPPVRAIAELAKHAGRVVDREMTAALEEVEQWLSGFALDDELVEPEENDEVGEIEGEVLEVILRDDVNAEAYALTLVARAVDELTKRTAAEWAALRSAIDEAAAESREQIQRSVRLTLGGGER